MKSTVVIIDGQGGKIGSLIIEKLIAMTDAELIAVGTNSIATSAMLKAGANYGATGENSVVVNCRDADIIVGPIGILSADSLLGEVTPVMANAVGGSRAKKVLIPLNLEKCNLYVAGLNDLTLNEMILSACGHIKEIIDKP
jgi:hypothetical protein